MSRSLQTHTWGWLIRVLALLSLTLQMPGLTAHAAPPPPLLSPAACADGTQASGAIYRICMPSFFPPWNGDLFVLAYSLWHARSDAPPRLSKAQRRNEP